MTIIMLFIIQIARMGAVGVCQGNLTDMVTLTVAGQDAVMSCSDAGYIYIWNITSGSKLLSTTCIPGCVITK